MTQFYFSFICLASGQTIVDDWYITCYNLVFTALPLCVRAITDSDIDLSDKKNIKRNLALLYRENRDKYKIFTFGKLIWKLSKGIIISLFIFIFCCTNEILIKGYNKNIWYLSLKSYICILIVVSSNLLINSHYIVYLLPLTILITTFILFIAFMFINHYGILFNFNSKGSIIISLSSPLTFLAIILICSFHFVLDYTGMILNLFLCHSLSNRLILKKLSHKKKKLPNKENQNSSKSVSKFIHKNGNNINFEECSNNYLVQKSFNNNNNNIYMDYLNGFKN
jgi:magnesium-transporting ATPase (P-type)